MAANSEEEKRVPRTRREQRHVPRVQGVRRVPQSRVPQPVVRVLHGYVRVFHVSGFPGSGKSTLGIFLEKHLKSKGVVVVDTDDLIQHNTPNGDRLAELEQSSDVDNWKTHNEAWREIFTTEISKTVEKYTKDKNVNTLIFVGILDHFGWGSDPVEIPECTKFYMDVPEDLLLYRFYSRFGSIPFKTDDGYWQNVSNPNNRWDIPGSVDYLKDASKSKNWHKEHGYGVASTKKIVEYIARSVGVVPRSILSHWTE